MKASVRDFVAQYTRHRMETVSPTRAMDSMYESYEASIGGFIEAFRPSKDQSSAIFAIDGAVIGFDLFDHPSTFEKLFPKLLQSYALDALDGRHRRFTTPILKDGTGYFRFHQYRTVSWQISMPRSNRRSSTSGSDSG